MGALCLRVIFAPTPSTLDDRSRSSRNPSTSDRYPLGAADRVVSPELGWVAGLASLYILGAVCLGDCAQWLGVDQIGLALFSVATASRGWC